VHHPKPLVRSVVVDGLLDYLCLRHGPALPF
jgi:hypothetical protein